MKCFGCTVSRRQLLATLGTGVVGGLSGCSGDGDEATATGLTTVSQATTGTPTNTAETMETETTADTTREEVGVEHVEVVTPALKDEPLDLRLVDLPPDTRVTVSATSVDRGGNEWQSRAVFESDANGTVVPTEQAPIEGTYSGADEMGLLWSMANETASYFSHATGWSVWLAVTVDGETVARRRIVRRDRAKGVTWEELIGETKGFFFEPPGDGPWPGVLLLHGSNGNPLYFLAEMLASHGYAALALDYFGGKGLPTELDEVPLSYFDDAVAWLRDSSRVADSDLAVMGYSRGTEPAVFTAARNDDVTVLVNYMPSSHVWAGDGGIAVPWTRDGEAVPYLFQSSNAEQTDDGYRYRPVYERGLEQAGETREQKARLPVTEMDAAALFVSGERDAVWPSTPMTETMMEWLDESGYDHEYEHLAFSGAGHWVHIPYQPTTDQHHAGGEVAGGTPAGIARAEAESWPRVLEYLERLR